ncbi:cell division protein CrgA [Demequina sp.]|uniref:cell division protein CrgA n=1 Tax=Demequina sp. TaxID=2050685 RepID=UPI003D0A4FF9
MPVSKKRDHHKQAVKVPRSAAKVHAENPKWLLPTAVTLLVLGPAWIIVYYISKGQFPLDIGHWNIGIGFAFLMASMILFTRWK